jgi:PPOX class probable F420-dependent enzyme
MGQPLPEIARRLFDGTNYVTVATVDPDAGVQTSIVWARVDGDDIVFSTIKDRRKYKNFERDSRVSIITFDPADPYRYAEVRGRVTVADDPGGSLLQELARKYTGNDSWPDKASDRRVIVRVTPEKVVTH